jgi:hypothetical protein
MCTQVALISVILISGGPFRRTWDTALEEVAI